MSRCVAKYCTAVRTPPTPLQDIPKKRSKKPNASSERGEDSIHPAYPFRVTARDLARFGLLMLHRGQWNGRRVIDADWVDESTRYHSDEIRRAMDAKLPPELKAKMKVWV